jgi:hypothetical protein
MSSKEELDTILDFLKRHDPKSRANDKQKKALRTLIGNLIDAYKADHNIKYYVGNQQSTPATIKNKLENAGLIIYSSGYGYDGGDSEHSKIKPLSLFNEVLNPLIRVKDGDKEFMGCDDPMRDRIVAYNEFMSLHDVRDGNGNKLNTDIFRRHLVKNGTEYKGRFYQSSYQLINEDARSQIQINGENVKRLDIKFSHPTIMHHQAGLELDREPYIPEDRLTTARPIFKLAFSTMVNNPSRNQARSAMTDRINKDPVRFKAAKMCLLENDISHSMVISMMEQHNQGIADRFYTCIANELMEVEADIIFRATEALSLVKQRIPALQVFDEIIIPESHTNDAGKVLEWAWSKELPGHKPQFKIK